jgi:carboxymethylenebutenolidase
LPQIPAITQSHSTFSSGGHSIAYDSFVPATNGERLPTIISLYGSGGDHAGMAEPASLFAEQGFAVYVLHYFDRTGHDEVNDKPTIMRNFPAWGKTVWDAISHLEKQPEVDGDRMGLLGFSLGAYLALSVAAVDPRVQAVVEFYGGLPKEMKFFMRRLCPTLILHGEADATIPVQEAYDLRDLLEKKQIPYEMQIYPGIGHGFPGPTWLDARQRTLAFFQKYLRASQK